MSTFDFREFQKYVTRVSPACSADDARPVLMTVHIYTTRAGTRFEAADGFRAYFMDTPSPIDGGKFDVMLSPATVKNVIKAKVMRNAYPQVTITPEGLVLEGKSLGGYETCGRYPEIQAVIPTHNPVFFHTFPAPFLAAVRPAYVFAKEGSGVVRLHITESMLVEGQSEETGHSVTEVSIRMKHGPEILIAFNGKFLIDFLKSAPQGEAIKFECNKPSAPALLTCKDGLRAVLMPMHLNVSGTPAPRRADDLKEREYSGTSYVWPDSPRTPRALEWTLAHAQPQAQETEWPFFPPVYTDDVFTSQPEPGAVLYDLTGAKFDVEVFTPEWGKPVHTPRMTLIVSNPRPDPSAPIAVDIPSPAYVRPVFENLCEGPRS